jgi:hypothetical protein
MTERGYPLEWLRSATHTDECTIWPFSVSVRGGYGQVRHEGRVRKAHQVSFALANGRDPMGMVLHSCDNPPCVNPAHLSEGCAADNTRDAVQRGRLPRCTDRPNGKVDAVMAEEVRVSPETGRQVAARLGLSEGLVSNIRTGKRTYDLLTAPLAKVMGPVHPDDKPVSA